jgi:hypothetical protein
VEKDFKTHPSYGMISVGRNMGGNGRGYFGSSIECPMTMAITISRGQVKHEHGQDWYLGGQELIEVKLTPSQWAEFISSIGMGPGVPCTINHLQGEVLKRPEFVVRETDEIRDDFKRKIDKMMKSFDETRAQIETLFANKKTLSQGDKTIVLNLLEKINTHVRSNMPFAVECFEESAEVIAKKVQRDIDAFVDTLSRRHGIDASQQLKQLTQSTKDDGPEESQACTCPPKKNDGSPFDGVGYSCPLHGR